MKHKDILCSCGGYCNGVCRELHLHRPRKHLTCCPAAYIEYPTRKSNPDPDDED